jgi:hypothetical protein
MRILLCGQQLIQVLLLGRGAAHRHSHTPQHEVPWRRAMIELGFGHGIQMAPDNNGLVIVQYMGDPVALCERGPDRKQTDRGNEPCSSAAAA